MLPFVALFPVPVCGVSVCGRGVGGLSFCFVLVALVV